jgi:hypothetical protein
MKRLMVTVVVATLAIALFTGCEKFLDRKPLSATVNDLQVGALEGQALGLYGAIRNSGSDPFIGDGMQNIAYLGMNGFRSDDAEIVADPGADAWHTTYDNFGYTKDDWGAGLYWDKHYVMIGICNDVIDLAKTANYTDPQSLVNVAEAKFFRAYTYFDMVRTFGEIPLIDFKITNPIDGQVAKSPVDAIYALIESDLTEAESVLPLQWEAKYIGRLTSGAAKTLHAKTLLYNKQWAASLALTKDVIASAQYELVPEYYTIFKKEGELNKESIFEIQASKNAGDGNIYWSRWGQPQGIRGASGTPWDLGWGWNTPTQALVSSYEVGDARKDATILESGKSDGGPTTGGYGLTIPALNNAKYWNKKVYNNYNDYLAAGLGTPNNEAQNTWVNQRVLRYADVLLMAAEAANEIGGAENEVDATTWVNMIRTRAKLPEIAFANQAQMRTAIKAERRHEFAMEVERFFDLVRWGDAINVLAGYQNKHRFFPIPGTALTANPKLVQNPEW